MVDKTIKVDWTKTVQKNELPFDEVYTFSKTEDVCTGKEKRISREYDMYTEYHCYHKVTK